MLPQTSTLFIIVSLMVVYRGIDLLSLKEKITQLYLKCITNEDSKLSFEIRRKLFREKSRGVIHKIYFLFFVKKEFPSISMGILIFLLFIVGSPTILKLNAPNTSTIIVALSTACIAIFASLMNLFIEQVKTLL